MRSSRTRIRLLAGAAAVGSLMFVAACGDDSDDAANTTEETTAESTAETTGDSAATDESVAEGETIAVTAVDYKFEDLPETIHAGDTLTLHNGSKGEFHELVALRIPDTETRSVDELLALPEAEAEALFGDAEPAVVLVAMPGEDGMPVVGTGAITEPGRYAVICSIPVGADPEAVAKAMQSATDGPPDLGDGPPHFTQGMHAELVVE